MENGKCFYSGINMVFDDEWNLFKPSIERIDNSKKYNIDNCVLVCMGINYGRITGTLNDFYNHLKTIKIH